MGSSRPFVPFLVLALALLASFAVPLAAGKIVIDTSNHKKQSVDVCIAQSLGNEYLQYYESAKVIGLSTAGTTSNEAIPDVNKQLNNYRQPNLTPETDLRELIKGNKLTQAAFQKYAYGLIPFAAPGIALGALSLIFMLFFIIARCACTHVCCPPGKKVADYDFCEQFLPFLFWLIFGLIGLGWCIVGIVSAGQLTDGLISVVCEVETLGTQSTNLVDSFSGPVDNIASMANTLIDDVNVTLSKSTTIGTGLTEITSNISSFVNKVASFSITIAGTTYTAGMSSSESAAVTSQMDGAAKTAVDTLSSIKSSTEGSLVSAKATIAGVSAAAAKTSNSTKELIKKNLVNVIKTFKTTIEPVRQYSLIGGSALFALFITSFVIGIPAILFIKFGKWTNCTGTLLDKLDDLFGFIFMFFSYFLGLLGMTLMFLLAGFILPGGVILSDMCIVMDEMPRDLNGYLGVYLESASGSGGGSSSGGPSINASAILEACLVKNDTIMNALNLTSSLDIGSSLSFGSLGTLNLESALDFTEFDKLKVKIDSLNVTTFQPSFHEDFAEASRLCGFGLPQTSVCLNNANTLSATKIGPCSDTVTYPGANCGAGSPGETACKTIRDNACSAQSNMTSLWSQVNATTASFRRDVQAIKTNIGVFSSNVRSFEGSMVNVSKQVQPLLDAVSSIKTVGSCGFVRERYDEIKSHLCQKSLSALLWVGLCLLLAALMTFPMIVCDVFIQVRIAGEGQSAVAHLYDADDDDMLQDGIELEDIWNKPENEFRLKHWETAGGR